jgi:hypothetical protein
MAGTAEQLPVIPDPQPPGPCVVCGQAVAKEDAYSTLRTPEYRNGVLLCAACTAETKATMLLIRERARQTGPPRPTALPEL